MNEPWLDFQSNTATTEPEGPWSDFKPAESPPWEDFKPIDTPSLQPVLSTESLAPATAQEIPVNVPLTPAFDPTQAETAAANVQAKELMFKGMMELPKVPIEKDDSRTMAAGKQAINVLIGIPEFFTSPVGRLALVGGMKAPTTTAGVFSADLLHSLGQQVRQNYASWDSMTPAEQGVAITDMLATGAFAGLTTVHTAKGAKAQALKAKDIITEKIVPGSVEIPRIETPESSAQRAQLIEEFHRPVPFTELTAAEVAEKVAPEMPAAERGAKVPETQEVVGMGGATMEEVAPSPTSLKNETGVLERHLHGLPEAYPGETQAMLPAMLRARRTLAKDPQAGFRLAEDLKQNPERGLTGDESALLLQHKDALLKAKNEAASKTLSKDPTIKAEGELAFETASNQLVDLLDALKFRGTQAGRELRWRQALLFEDWSFESMRSDKQASLGRKLSEAENTQIKELHDKIAELEKQLADSEGKATETERATGLGESVQEVVETSKKRAAKEKAEGIERDLDAEQADVITRLKEHAQETGDLVGTNPSIQKLMELLARRGITERTAMEQAVHKIVKSVMPDMSLLEVQDLMSGYGKYKPLSKDPIKTIVRGIRGEIQQVRKLLDFFSGKPPAKTGVERRIPTDKERAFIKVVNEAKKAFGTIPTDPAKALKSALDAINTRLKNRLSDLKQEVATRQRIVKERSPSPYNEETLRLRKEIEEVQKQHEEIFGKRELTDAQRLSIAEKAADRQIAELERQLKTGEIFSKTKEPSNVRSDKLDAARAKIEALKEERAAARETIQPSMEPEAKLLQQILTRYRNLEASYKDRLARGDFSKRVRKEQPTSDATLDARARLEQAKNEFRKGLHADQMSRRTLPQKIWDGIKLTRGAIVNIKSSFDFSAPRQALFAILSNTTRLATHPAIGARMLGRPFADMFKSWASESGARRIEQRIKDRLNAKSGADKTAGIEYTELDTNKFTKYEENAHSIIDEWAALPFRTGSTIKTVAGAIPKAGARAVRMSNRAFIAFLNSTRASLFDELLRANFKDRAPSDLELKAVGNLVNIATGRGKLSPMTGRVAAEVLWAPKLLASRVQALTGQPFYTGTARSRKIVAKEYARAIVGGYLLWNVSRIFDDKKETSPTATDFGKIVRGDVRIDPWGGFQQVTVLGARTITAETTTIKGQERDIGAARKYGQRGLWHTWADFGRSKLRPDVGMAVDVLTRTTFIGEPTTVSHVAESTLVPLPMHDIVQIMQAQGFTEGMITEALGQFGAGISLYENRQAQK